MPELIQKEAELDFICDLYDSDMSVARTDALLERACQLLAFSLDDCTARVSYRLMSGPGSSTGHSTGAECLLLPSHGIPAEIVFYREDICGSWPDHCRDLMQRLEPHILYRLSFQKEWLAHGRIRQKADQCMNGIARPIVMTDKHNQVVLRNQYADESVDGFTGDSTDVYETCSEVPDTGFRILIGHEASVCQVRLMQHYKLSVRQADVCLLLMKGYVPGDIALHLGISVNTVKNVLMSCFRKLNVCSQSELILRLSGRNMFHQPTP